MNNKFKGKKKPVNGRVKPVKGEQGRKDSRTPRVNFDNTRVDKFEKDESKWVGTPGSNDVKWYASNPELLKSAASLSFSFSTGQFYPWVDRVNPSTITSSFSIPGVASYIWVPQIGGEFVEPINQASNSIYSYVVHANSRNKSYDHTDMMLLILAGAQIFSGLAAGYRVYGTMLRYTQENNYLPEALVAMMGFDFADLRNNLSKMWFDLNELAARTKQVWIPNTLPLVERWYWMNSNVYMDSASIKDQYYLYRQGVYWKYSEVSSTSGGELVVAKNGNPDKAAYGTWKWAEYMEMMNDMLTGFIDSQDRGIICGDFLKAYGPDKLYAVQSITSDYTVVPLYDQEVLTQMMNITPASGVYCSGIKQDTNKNRLYGVYDFRMPSQDLPTSLSKQAVPFDYALLNFKIPTTPTPEQVMVATRMMALGAVAKATNADSSKYLPLPKTCGTETVICSAECYRYLNSDKRPAITYNRNAFVKLSSAFDWRNIYYTKASGSYSTTTTTIPAIEVEYIDGELENCTPIHYSDLMKMHNTAIYSLFGVPQM